MRWWCYLGGVLSLAIGLAMRLWGSPVILLQLIMGVVGGLTDILRALCDERRGDEMRQCLPYLDSKKERGLEVTSTVATYL